MMRVVIITDTEANALRLQVYGSDIAFEIDGMILNVRGGDTLNLRWARNRYSTEQRRDRMTGSKNDRRKRAGLKKFIRSLHEIESRQTNLKALIRIANVMKLTSHESFPAINLECRARRTTLSFYNQLLTLRRSHS